MCVWTFFFFLREVLVDNLLPAVGAASCSSQQWGKRAGEARFRGAGWAAAGGGKGWRLGASHIRNGEVICLRSRYSIDSKSNNCRWLARIIYFFHRWKNRSERSGGGGRWGFHANRCNLTVKPAGRQLKVDSCNCTGAAVTAVGCQPHGTLQMVNWPVTIDTINDYMHKRNGQKAGATSESWSWGS